MAMSQGWCADEQVALFPEAEGEPLLFLRQGMETVVRIADSCGMREIHRKNELVHQ
jgi:hypothetical protein